MPRSRNRNHANLIIHDDVSEQLLDDFVEPVRPVKDFLKNEYWDLKKFKNEILECAICLNNIDCKNCYCLLSCGHGFHISCVIRTDKCPLCRN